MEATRPTKRAIMTVMVMAIAMLFTLLVPAAQTAEASTTYGPCPHYGIQDVFNDPNGNWDGDQVKNGDELYNGLNPCLVDTAAFCGGGGNPLCIYSGTTYGYIEYVQKDVVNNPCHRSTFLYPHDDYDFDGVTNQNEIAAGTDPCIYDAPHYYTPHHYNPHHYNPHHHNNTVACPNYTVHHVTAAPNYDWDGDGVTNLVEWRQGTNPCVYNAPVVHYQPRVHIQPGVYRLPHITTTSTVTHPVVRYTAPVVQTRICPAGYPYFHPGNGQCYANPVKSMFG